MAAFCDRLGHDLEASAGAHQYCFRPKLDQTVGDAGPRSQALAAAPASCPASARSSYPGNPTGVNADAAAPLEDATPACVQAYGQSEVSVAAVGSYVLEAWNDATGFFSPCPSALNREELTGIGFSNDSGSSFVDLGSPPNSNCGADLYFGDPSVEGWSVNGTAHFYVSSLFDSPSFAGKSYLALAACSVSTAGPHSLSCSQPIIAAASSECGGTAGGVFSCSFLDKDFLALDRTNGRLYVAYTEFGVTPKSSLFDGQIEVAACDVGTQSGGSGPLGGTAAAPVCSPGSGSKPYLVVAPGTSCLNEGAYPAVAANGDLYVGYEYNWVSFFGGSSCASKATQNILDLVSGTCLTLPAASCTGPTTSARTTIVSLNFAFVPGYNRFPMNDFPRVAVAGSTVSMVWNDARSHPWGDIMLQSFSQGGLAPVQSAPVTLNPNTGGWHILPALRYANASGQLDVSWYERGSPTTSVTDVVAVEGVSPTASATPASSTLITSTPTEWLNDSSDIIPNFGDYTDNFVAGDTFFVAWSDGRLGLPQPFEAHMAG